MNDEERWEEEMSLDEEAYLIYPEILEEEEEDE